MCDDDMTVKELLFVLMYLGSIVGAVYGVLWLVGAL